jgi:phospholipid N-methyltransferase
MTTGLQNRDRPRQFLKNLLNDYGRFIRTFVKDPLAVGSVAPSSPYLAKSILQAARVSDQSEVVEYGPGTGAFTVFLQALLAGTDAQLILIEMHPVFCQLLRERFPTARVIEARASEVRRHISAGQIDLVISSLPFTFIPWHDTRETILRTHEILRVGGEFRTYLYLTSLIFWNNLRLLWLLHQTFKVRYRVVFFNFPPAIIMECHKDHLRAKGR